MAGIVGSVDITGSVSTINASTPNELNTLDIQIFNTGDVVTQVDIYISGITAAEITLPVGLYENPDLSVDPNGTLVWSKDIVIPISTPVGWYSTLISDEAITGTDGYEIGAARGKREPSNIVLNYGDSGNLRSESAVSATLAPTWSETGTATRIRAFTVTTEAGGSPPTSVEIDQAITSQTSTTITLTSPTNVLIEPVLGVPQDGLPYTAGVALATGSTLVSLEQVVTNG